MDRYTTVDLCRGLLFILMMNTHALTISGVPDTHWFFSDLWLPNGWATVVFVVLSGYCVGFIYSNRDQLKRDEALRRRGIEILAVMFASNAVFSILKLMVAGNLSPVFSFEWWLGFMTLETDWTVSGVLLPTGLVLFCGPAMIRWTQKNPWLVFVTLALAHFSMPILATKLGLSIYAGNWAIRFFVLEGFGGFPLLPFMVNGCIGIWLGIQQRCNTTVWRRTMAALLIFQLLVYFSTIVPFLSFFQPSFSFEGAVGRFAWMLLIAYLLDSPILSQLTPSIELIGKFALCSFVMHRFILQILAIILSNLGLMKIQMELRFMIIFSVTLLFTWALCFVRQQVIGIDSLFRRFGL